MALLLPRLPAIAATSLGLSGNDSEEGPRRVRQVTRRTPWSPCTAPGAGKRPRQIYNAYVNKTPLIITAGQQAHHAKPVLPLTKPRNEHDRHAILCERGRRRTAIASERPPIGPSHQTWGGGPPKKPHHRWAPRVRLADHGRHCRVELDDNQISDTDAVRERT